MGIVSSTIKSSKNHAFAYIIVPLRCWHTYKCSIDPKYSEILFFFCSLFYLFFFKEGKKNQINQTLFESSTFNTIKKMVTILVLSFGHKFISTNLFRTCHPICCECRKKVLLYFVHISPYQLLHINQFRKSSGVNINIYFVFVCVCVCEYVCITQMKKREILWEIVVKNR